MDDRDRTGIFAALAAIALAVAAWLWNPEPGMVRDEVGLARASNQALEINSVGQPMTWRDRLTGTQATIIPASAYRDIEGRLCRPYSVQLASAAGQWETSRRLACREGGGQWMARPEPIEARPNGFDQWLARLAEPGEQVAGSGRY